MGTHFNRLAKTCCGYSLESVLMSTHNVCFCGEIMKIIPKYSSNTLLICFTDMHTSENMIFSGHGSLQRCEFQTYSSKDSACCLDLVMDLSKLSIPPCQAMFHDIRNISRGRPVSKGSGYGSGATWLGLLS